MQGNLILDFDSTFVQVEALDELARICLSGAPDFDASIKQIEELTELAMTGKMGFGEALSKRLQLFAPGRPQIDQLVERLRERVSTSIVASRDFLEVNAAHIYVISGGFREYVVPVVSDYGIAANHVMANEFLWDAVGTARGCDPDVALAHDSGKVTAIRELNLERPVMMVGDGFSDLQPRQQGVVDHFMAFVENVDRPNVTALADSVAHDFGEVQTRLESLAHVANPRLS